MHFKKFDKPKLWLDFPLIDLLYSLNISIEKSVVKNGREKT